MDRVTLRGVRAFGRHGVQASERERPQPFDVDVSAEVDLRAAQASDAIADTLDYAALHARIVEIVEGTPRALIERLAGDILDALFEDRRVARARVTVAKPGILGGATPAVTLQRDNPRYRAS